MEIEVEWTVKVEVRAELVVQLFIRYNQNRANYQGTQHTFQGEALCVLTPSFSPSPSTCINYLSIFLLLSFSWQVHYGKVGRQGSRAFPGGFIYLSPCLLAEMIIIKVF